MTAASASAPSTPLAGHKPGVATWLAHGGKVKAAKPKAVIGMMAFAIMNVTTIVSLRGMPAQAEYGLASIFYYLFASIVFLIPVSLVAAELAAAFPKQGGVFRWVGEAFGPRWGFAALYYQWQAIVIWFPTVLIFAAAALAYIWWPQTFDEALSNNKLYTIVVLLAVYWFVTLFTFRGMQSSARLSSLGGLFGTIIPGAILIALGIAYVAMGKPMHLALDTGFIPDFGNFHNMVLAAGIFLYFAGMEMQAVHVQSLANPARNYPLSVLIATVMVVAIFVLGTLAVGVVIPREAIDLNHGLLVAYNALWASFGLPWLGNVMAAMLAFGVLGQVSVIVAGPSMGLLAVGKAGYLPHLLQKTNAHGMPVAILVLQGLLVTALCVAFTILPSVQSAYQLLSQMATIIYLVMYLVMYVAAIRLRYTQPDRPRPFKIPGGNAGMWFVGMVGCGAAIATVFSFIPPGQISTGNPVFYVGSLLIGSAVFLSIPFIIYAFHKPGWKAADSDFEPFDGKTDKSAAAPSVPVPQPAIGKPARTAIPVAS